MPNPYVNKVEVNGQAIIDLTGDTITPEALAQGVTAHNAAGAPIVGTMETGGGVATDIPAYTYTGTAVETTMGADEYMVVKLLSSGDLTFEKDALLDVFLVGGGGAGGWNMGGGGGGGYCVTRRSLAVRAGETIPVVVGAGGSGTAAAVGYYAANGGNTSITVHGEVITTYGGQGGKLGNGSSNGYRTGGTGGSGGGGGSYGSGNYKGGNGGTIGKDGDAGGYSSGNSAKRGHGGTGQRSSSSPHPNTEDWSTFAFGEAEATYNIWSKPSSYANPWYGGGGGGAGSSGRGGTGGKAALNQSTGGGGNGATSTGEGQDGEANTGGGGGGSAANTYGGNGGSGIVLLRFAREKGETTGPVSSGGEN